MGPAQPTLWPWLKLVPKFLLSEPGSCRGGCVVKAGSQGPAAACHIGMGGGGGSCCLLSPLAVSLGDPRKGCLCVLSTPGLWRHKEIQASAELA